MKSIFIAFALVFAIVSGITATVVVLHPQPALADCIGNGC